MPSSAPSPSPSPSPLAPRELLGAAQADADRREREVMNLKMEVAHLRERLLQRVGGNATAAELEAETSALQAALREAQLTLAAREQALRELEARHAKAMRNVLKLDRAWQRSAEEGARATQRVEELTRFCADHEDEARRKEEQYEEEGRRWAERVQEMEEKAARVESEQVALRQRSDDALLKVKELEAQLATMRQRSAGASREEGAGDETTRARLEALQRQFQEATEERATLRGEAMALREEREGMQKQLTTTKESLAASMTKYLQLKEAFATLEVRMMAARGARERGESDVGVFKKQVERLQREVMQRDERQLQHDSERIAWQAQAQKLQERITELAVAKEQAVTEAEEQAEHKWKQMEAELQSQMYDLLTDQQHAEEALQALRQEQQQICETLWQHLHGETGLDVVSGGTEQGAERGDDALRSMVTQLIARENDAATRVREAEKRANKATRELQQRTQLVHENDVLRAEVERTKKAMERIIGRKEKATANALRGARTSSTGNHHSGISNGGDTTNGISSSSNITNSSNGGGSNTVSSHNSRGVTGSRAGASVGTPPRPSRTRPSAASIASLSLTETSSTTQTSVSTPPTITSSCSNSADRSLAGTKRKLHLHNPEPVEREPLATKRINDASSPVRNFSRNRDNGHTTCTATKEAPLTPSRSKQRVVHVRSRYLQPQPPPRVTRR